MTRKRLITNRKWIAEAFSRKTVWKSRDMGSSQRNQNQLNLMFRTPLKRFLSVFRMAFQIKH